jgi:hypothetical protein
MFIGSPLLAVPSMGLAIGLGTFLAWTHRDRSRPVRRQGLALALFGSLLGGGLGFGAVAGLAGTLSTIVGATLVANLGLLVLDIRSGRRAARQADVLHTERWVEAVPL